MDNDQKISLDLFDLSPDLVGISRLSDGLILYGNIRFEELTGYSPDEFLNHTSIDIGLWADDKEREKMLELLSRDGEVRNLEFLLRNREGAVHNCIISARPIRYNNYDCLIFVIQDITAIKETDRCLTEERNLLRTLIDNIPDAIYVKDKESRFMIVNRAAASYMGFTQEEIIGRNDSDLFAQDLSASTLNDERQLFETGNPIIEREEWRYDSRGARVDLQTTKIPLIDSEGKISGLLGMERVTTDKKVMEEALKNMVVALTKPLDDPEGIQFTDLFNIEELQKIQDSFSEAVGIASIITYPDGRPITRPSNFTRFCQMVRATEKGCMNCYRSDAELGKSSNKGPIIATCLSGGLWDGGASITLGGKHMANWLVGQVRNEAVKEKSVARYADEIGVNKESFMEALNEVPVMSKTRFEKVCWFLFNLANELSLKAYQNIQQGRFINEQKQAEKRIKEMADLQNTILDTVAAGIAFIRDRHFVWANASLFKMLGYKQQELQGKEVRIIYTDDESYERIGNDGYSELKHGSVYSTEVKMKKKNGEIVWVSLAGKALNPENLSDGTIWMLLDITEQKASEIALLKSESVLLSTIEGMSDGILVVLQDNKVTHYNTSFVRLFNIPEKIITSMDDTMLLAHAKMKLAEPGLFLERIDQIKRSGDTSEDILLFLDGRIVERHSYPLGTTEESAGRVWIFRDITERKRNEEIILKNQQLLSDSQRIAQIGCWEYYYNTDRLIFNDEALKIYGYNLSESYIQLETFLRHLHPDDRSLFSDKLNSGKTRRKIKDFECRIAVGEGKFKTTIIVGAVLSDENKNAFKAFGIIQDITKRKESELALQASESILKATMESMSDGILVVSKGGAITHYNNRFLDIFELSDEVIAANHIKPVLEYLKNMLNRADYYYEKDMDIMNSHVATEDQLYLTNGKIIERMSFPLVENNEIKGRVWSFRDITSRKLAEEEINNLNAQLEKRVFERTMQLRQLNRDLESFTYSVSHDLRAPLRHIDGFIKLMYSKMTDHSETVRHYYTKIETASQRMSDMIESLLSFSRLGRKELSLSLTDLSTLLNEVIEEASPDIEHRLIEWDISPLPQIKCDRSLMKMTFENLVSNALKYTSKKDKAIIKIGWNQVDEDKIELYLKDNGAGFDMAYADKLFGVFQRLHSPEEFEGVGIGLANVRQIIEKHNGSVRAEGKPDEGAVFYITLPK